MKITEDLVLGARFTINHTGGSLLRLFEVTGLTPGRDTLAQAAGAQDSATGSTIPRYGDPHPSAPGLFVAQIEAEPIKNSRTAARISVRYATPEASSVPNVVRVAIRGSSRAKIISTSAADGSALVVKYTDPAGNALQEFLQIPVLCPNTVLEFTRQEPRSPLRLSLSFRRSVNSTAWQGGDARTWLCRGINAASLNNLTRYEVKYIFEYDPDGWERLEYYIDPFTGKVPDDVQPGQNNTNGVTRVLPYQKLDFGQLGLPNVY